MLSNIKIELIKLVQKQIKSRNERQNNLISISIKMKIEAHLQANVNKLCGRFQHKYEYTQQKLTKSIENSTDN